MKKVRWVSATAGAALVAAMFALPGAGVAYASDNGADLLLLGVAALVTIGVGAGAVAAHEPGYDQGVCASGIHALFAWLLLCRLRMCGLGV